MKLTMLGTGNAMVTKCYNTCFVLREGEECFLVDGGADFSDFCELFSLRLGSDASTVSGWVTEELQRLPQAGDSFRAEGLEVTVTRVDHRRVLEIRAMECKEAGVEV